jgi:hypothetical protein
MKFNEARFLKKGTVIYYAGTPVKFVRLEKACDVWFVVVNDEKENSIHEDKLLLTSVTRKFKES